VLGPTAGPGGWPIFRVAQQGAVSFKFLIYIFKLLCFTKLIIIYRFVC